MSGSWVSLSWTWKNRPGDVTIAKYQYKLRAMDAESVYPNDWADIAGGGSVVHYYFTPLPHSPLLNKHVNAQVQAVNAAGESIASGVASTKPLAAPSGLEASLDETEGSLSLSWDNPFDDSINKYEYQVKAIGTGTSWPDAWTEIDISTQAEIDVSTQERASTFSTPINNVAGSGQRNVQLRAKGDNNPAAIVSTGVPAALPLTGFSTPGGSVSQRWRELNAASSPAGSPGSIVVRWSDPGDESILKYQYRFRAQSRPDSYSQWIDIPDSGASTTEYTFVFPTPEMYRVRLRAVNSAGGGSGRTVTDFNVKPFWPALAAPSGLEADLKGSSVHLSWDNPFDGSIHKYQYRIKTVGGSWPSEWTDAVTASISNSGISTLGTISATIPVTGSGHRIVQLRAVRRSLGDPSESATASTGVPAALPLTGFSTPGGSVSQRWRELNAASSPAGSPGSIVVRWSDPGDESILKYQYRFRAQSRPDSYSQWIDIPDSGASTTEYTFVFPTPEMYRVRLRAVNSAGGGSGRTVTDFNVKPFWPALAAPSGLEADLKGSSVHLSWDNPFDGSIHKYQYRIKTVGGSWPSEWTDAVTASISNSGISTLGTISATIPVTGSGHRIVQLRAVRRSLGDPSSSAEASTE